MSYYSRFLLMLPDFRSAFAIYGKTPSYNSSTSVVIFPDNAVKTNIGNDYDSTTGQFTCRYAGVYIFVVNLYRFNRDDNRLKCYIQKNGTKVVDANAPASSEYEWSGGSGSTVVHLDQGDTVNVGSCLGDNNFSMFTSFMGFLLQAD